MKKILISIGVCLFIFFQIEQVLAIQLSDEIEAVMQLIDQRGYLTNEDAWQKFYEDVIGRKEQYSSEYIFEVDLLRGLKLAGGQHSRLIKNVSELSSSKIDDTNSLPEVEFLEDEIVKIKLPKTSSELLSYETIDGDDEYVSSYRSAVLNLVNPKLANIKGIIIDLRDNSGGFSVVMYQAINFLFDNDVLMYQVQKDGERIVRYAMSNNAVLTDNNKKEFLFERTNIIDVPVAVLINHQTASAGEFLTLSIKERKSEQQVKIFGLSTAGYTSATEAYDYLEDNVLMITVGAIETIKGNRYFDQSITPDVESETAEQEALEWLKQEIEAGQKVQ